MTAVGKFASIQTRLAATTKRDASGQSTAASKEGKAAPSAFDGAVESFRNARDKKIAERDAHETATPKRHILYSGPLRDAARSGIGAFANAVVTGSAAKTQAKSAETTAAAEPASAAAATAAAEADAAAEAAKASAQQSAAAAEDEDKRWEALRKQLDLPETADRKVYLKLAEDLETLGASVGDLAANDFTELRKKLYDNGAILAAQSSSLQDRTEIADRTLSAYEGLRQLEKDRAAPQLDETRNRQLDEMGKALKMTEAERARTDSIARDLQTLGLDLTFLSESGLNAVLKLRDGHASAVEKADAGYLATDLEGRAAARAAIDAAFNNIANTLDFAGDDDIIINRGATLSLTGQTVAARAPASGSAITNSIFDNLLASASASRGMSSVTVSNSASFNVAGLSSMLSRGNTITEIAKSLMAGFNSASAATQTGGFMPTTSSDLKVQNTLQLFRAFGFGLSLFDNNGSAFSASASASSQMQFSATDGNTTTSVSVGVSASASVTNASGMTSDTPDSFTVSGVTIKSSVVVSWLRGSGGTASQVPNFYDPLVLDLAGDGFDLRSAEDGVAFDYDGSGTARQGGFVRNDDALLFLASEDNGGLVRDGRDLFGDADGHSDGFAKLASFDSNKDGVIDALDDIYSKLRVWQDRNGDGVCDADEVMSLEQAGVKSLNVNYQTTRETDASGNVIAQRGAFTRTDGSEGQMADVLFKAK